MVKVFKFEKSPGGIISSAEAKHDRINTKSLPLASIEDCKKYVLDVIAEDAGYSGGYGGRIKVIEGVFKFNFDINVYEQVI